MKHPLGTRNQAQNARAYTGALISELLPRFQVFGVKVWWWADTVVVVPRACTNNLRSSLCSWRHLSAWATAERRFSPPQTNQSCLTLAVGARRRCSRTTSPSVCLETFSMMLASSVRALPRAWLEGQTLEIRLTSSGVPLLKTVAFLLRLFLFHPFFHFIGAIVPPLSVLALRGLLDLGFASKTSFPRSYPVTKPTFRSGSR